MNAAQATAAARMATGSSSDTTQIARAATAIDTATAATRIQSDEYQGDDQRDEQRFEVTSIMTGDLSLGAKSPLTTRRIIIEQGTGNK